MAAVVAVFSSVTAIVSAAIVSTAVISVIAIITARVAAAAGRRAGPSRHGAVYIWWSLRVDDKFQSSNFPLLAGTVTDGEI